MKRNLLLMLVALGCGLASCTNDTNPSTDGLASLSFKVSTPRAPLTLTRAIASYDEWNIASLDLYAANAGVVEKLTATDDFTISPALSNTPNQVYTVTLTEAWLNPRGGETLNFYVVANDATSTGGAHTSLEDNLASEDDFRDALANALTVDAGTGLLNPIVQPDGATHNLLFSGDMQNLIINGRIQQPLQLKRREARFDIQNKNADPALGAKQLLITGIRIFNAANTGLIFGSGDPSAVTVDRTDNIELPGIDPAAYTETAPDSEVANDLATGVFYLYPTTLVAPDPAVADKTQIIVDGTYDGETVQYPVDVKTETAINANFRYILRINPTTSTIDLIGEEYEEGGTVDSDPGVNATKATLTPETASITPATATYTTFDANAFVSVEPSKDASMPLTIESETGTTWELIPVTPLERNPIKVTRLRELDPPVTRAARGIKETYTVTIPAGIGFAEAWLKIDSGKDSAGEVLGADSVLLRRMWGGDASAILYYGSDGTLRAGSWDEIKSAGAQERIALFKFGSVVGMDNTTATFDPTAVKFNPSGATITDYPSVPVYTSDDFDADLLNISDPAYHNGANIALGKGDPCQLIGLSAATIKNMSAATLNAYQSGFRMPTVMENVAFVGGPAEPFSDTPEKTFWKSWQPASSLFFNYIDASVAEAITANPTNPYDFLDDTRAGTLDDPFLCKYPVATSYAPAFSMVLSDTGIRNESDGLMTIGSVYWSSTAADNTMAFMLGFNPGTTPNKVRLYGESHAVRCVPTGSKTAQPLPVPAEDPKVGGVVWAKSNVQMPGQFAKMPADAGYFYQWGQNTPWSNSDPLANMNGGDSTWPTTLPSNDALAPWPDAMDVCPAGYRMPVTADFTALADETKVGRTWLTAGQTSPATGVAYGNLPGYEFTDYTTGDAVFFPAEGLRALENGLLKEPGLYGYYWAATPSDKDKNFTLRLNADVVNPAYSYGSGYGFSVRCVKDVPPPPAPEAVTVGGVQWAQTNVAMPGKFAATPDFPGYVYQWGQNIPWSNTDPLTNMSGGSNVWTNVTDTNTTWPTEKDPCPEGWRLPAPAEFSMLVNTANVDQVQITASVASSRTGTVYAVAGFEFIDKSNGNVVFFPNIAYRDPANGAFQQAFLLHWANAAVPDKLASAYDLSLYQSPTVAIVQATSGKGNGSLLRCVKDIPASGL